MRDPRTEETPEIVLVARTGGFGRPTACPICLPVYFYLRLAKVFGLRHDRANPNSDHVPYIEHGYSVAFDNEGGVIECLNEDDIVILDSKISKDCFLDLLCTKVIISTWLAEAEQYELWVACDQTITDAIYFSDLSWPIGKILHWKQSKAVKQLHGITNLVLQRKREEVCFLITLVFNL
ncbi:unnamed protein product [Musa acuminata var. zebrina]